MEYTGLSFENEHVQLSLTGEEQAYWTYRVKASNRSYTISAPVFEIDGMKRVAALTEIRPLGVPQPLSNGCTEYRFEGVFIKDPSLALELIFRLPDHNPVLRFAYILKSNTPHVLTKTQGQDALEYLRVSLASLPQVKEVHISEFVELVHSYCLAELPLEERFFADEVQVMGPILCGSDTNEALLIAYEHGSTTPHAFLFYQLTKERNVVLHANKGNYYHGQPLDPDHSYQTLWLQLAAIDGDENTLADTYRTFVLRYQSLQAESRKPYIFYNTWNFQERNKWWYGNRYLDSMHQERILSEIDVAHRMGVEVYVIDTGWYLKTGDWQVNIARFDDHLHTVKARLNSYGMKLGLWFDPTAAAVTSHAALHHLNGRRSWHGTFPAPHPVWETEESYKMCLVSAYSDQFADELIRLAREVGVTYFKWDAIDQYGCDDPHHWHGTTENSAEERADCYAFQMIREMTRLVEKVCEAVPEAIVDFDVTESHRAVGLSFLSAGKYFLINNGPYYQNYNVPIDLQTQNSNLFFHPGPARSWICRTPLNYDKWLPSVLFLTHYLPDDPQEYQLVSIASLILGQNGIWGDLLNISTEGISLFGDLLARYKAVREDITASAVVRYGQVGGSPEIYEKLSSRGRGAVVIFSTIEGRYTYVTSRCNTATAWHADGVEVVRDSEGRARITATFAQGGAKIIFFDNNL